jgi:hypothetical protein
MLSKSRFTESGETSLVGREIRLLPWWLTGWSSLSSRQFMIAISTYLPLWDPRSLNCVNAAFRLRNMTKFMFMSESLSGWLVIEVVRYKLVSSKTSLALNHQRPDNLAFRVIKCMCNTRRISVFIRRQIHCVVRIASIRPVIRMINLLYLDSADPEVGGNKLLEIVFGNIYQSTRLRITADLDIMWYTTLHHSVTEKYTFWALFFE